VEGYPPGSAQSSDPKTLLTAFDPHPVVEMGGRELKGWEVRRKPKKVEEYRGIHPP
jgi:hypothetical protein